MYEPIENAGIFPTKKGNYTLLYDAGKEFSPFAVVLNYDATKKYGDRWDAGHYYEDIYEAITSLKRLGE